MKKVFLSPKRGNMDFQTKLPSRNGAYQLISRSLTNLFFLSGLIGLSIILCCAFSPVGAQPTWLLEGEVSQEIIADFEEDFIDSETALELEFELGESLTFDGEFVNETPGDDDVVNEVDFDLEVFPDFGERDLSIYFEGNFVTDEGENLSLALREKPARPTSTWGWSLHPTSGLDILIIPGGSSRV